MDASATTQFNTKEARDEVGSGGRGVKVKLSFVIPLEMTSDAAGEQPGTEILTTVSFPDPVMMHRLGFHFLAPPADKLRSSKSPELEGDLPRDRKSVV